jgi:CheY-like chemotaxis protein
LDILIVEDEAILAMEYLMLLQGLGFPAVEHAFDAKAALAAVERCLPKVILLDIKLRGKTDGIEVAEIIRSRHDVPIVFITSYADADTLERAWRTRPAYVLNKIGDHREFCRVVVELMNSQRRSA